MAQREWARMKANDSQECRHCHNFNDMDTTQQKNVAQKMHRMAQELKEKPVLIVIKRYCSAITKYERRAIRFFT